MGFTGIGPRPRDGTGGNLRDDPKAGDPGAVSKRISMCCLRKSTTLILALVLATGVVAHAARYRSPFDGAWSACTVTWDHQKNALWCHGRGALLVGEETASLQVGTERGGQPVRAKFRLLTYRCEHDQHQVRVWLTTESPGRVCEVSCHGKIAGDKGYDKDRGGLAVSCKEDHTLYLKGSSKGESGPSPVPGQ